MVRNDTESANAASRFVSKTRSLPTCELLFSTMTPPPGNVISAPPSGRPPESKFVVCPTRGQARRSSAAGVSGGDSDLTRQKPGGKPEDVVLPDKHITMRSGARQHFFLNATLSKPSHLGTLDST